MALNFTLPQLLRTLMDQGASDLHISAGSPPRLRIDGHLIPLQLEPLTGNDCRELCYSILTEQQKKNFENSKEIDLAFSVQSVARFRANIYLQKSNVSGAFRLIPYRIKTLDELGLPPVIRRLSALPRGLVLITGATGSGKSTTMAAMIDHINASRFDHIVTIEDPIEFLHAHKNCIINQREVGGDTKSFASALKSGMRQDPDVVMVGEMRDLETIGTALTTAETGHMVLATLHTNSCVATLNRIIDVFPPHQQPQVRTQLAMTLEAVVSQTLIPAIGGGRALAMEVLVTNHAIRAMISEGKFNQIYSSMQAGQDGSGMQTMNQALAALVEQRIIERATANAKSNNVDELTELIENPTRGRRPTVKAPSRAG